jgi:hypothetical protein
VELVDTDNVVLPEPVTVAGLKLPVAPLGKPLMLRPAVPVKPFTAVTDAV